MFFPPDLIIRGLRPKDVPEVYKMLNAALKEEEGAELKRQIRFIFMHPAIWILSGILICAFGISLRWVQLELFNCKCTVQGWLKKVCHRLHELIPADEAGLCGMYAT